MDEKCVDSQGATMPLADGVSMDFLFYRPLSWQATDVTQSARLQYKVQKLLRVTTMSNIRIHKFQKKKKKNEHPQGTVIFEVKQQQRQQKVCAQNAKLTQKYDIWIKIPNDEYLNTLKAASMKMEDKNGTGLVLSASIKIKFTTKFPRHHVSKQLKM